MSEIHERISVRKIPVDSNGCTLLDLYILMPASRRYVPFVRKGDKLNDTMQEKLKKHVLPEIFVIPSELNIAMNLASNKKEIESFDDSEEIIVEMLGTHAEKELKAICSDLLSDKEQDPQVLVSTLQTTSDKILSIVAPESKDLTKVFFNNVKYINLMNDTAAIASLAVIFAFANGFDSKKSYTELTQAALVMDVALSVLNDEQRKLYYTQPDNLPEELKALIQNHPQRSFELVKKKLPALSDVTLQLILNHHELFNGRGYPRKVRTESLFPLVKILALAVDVYESLKKHTYEGSSTSLEDIIFEIHNSTVEAHLRRHNRTITQKVLDFLDKQGQKAA